MSKAQLELSVNTIVIIVVSIAIVVTGIVMLYKFQKGLASTYYTMDKQTEELLKSFMLKNNNNIAVYPQYITIAPGSNAGVGLGLTNSFDDKQRFDIVLKPKVKFYNIYASPVTTQDLSNTGWGADMKMANSTYIRMNEVSFSINPKNQDTRGILINIPRNVQRGEYEITLTVIHKSDPCTGSCSPADYGTVKIYVTTG